MEYLCICKLSVVCMYLGCALCGFVILNGGSNNKINGWRNKILCFKVQFVSPYSGALLSCTGQNRRATCIHLLSAKPLSAGPGRGLSIRYLPLCDAEIFYRHFFECFQLFFFLTYLSNKLLLFGGVHHAASGRLAPSTTGSTGQ